MFYYSYFPIVLDVSAPDGASYRDFTETQQYVTIPAFSGNEVCFGVNITDDTAVEENRECFSVSLALQTSPTVGVINLIDTEQDCCIIDDDSKCCIRDLCIFRIIYREL